MRRQGDALIVAERVRARDDIDAAAARARAAEAAAAKHTDLIRAMRARAAIFAEATADYPSSWGSARGACPVARADPEWARVERLLRDSLPTARLTALDAVRNEHLWRLYRGAHGVMVAKALGKALGKGTTGAVNELELWHGTGATDPGAICGGERGFDPTYAIAARTTAVDATSRSTRSTRIGGARTPPGPRRAPRRCYWRASSLVMRRISERACASAAKS